MQHNYHELRSDLQRMLRMIEAFDEVKNYDGRNNTILMALGIAIPLGLSAGIRFDPSEPEWPVVYIELPTGQVSWHLPQHVKAWDKHTNEEKHQRVRDYCAR